MRTKLYLSALCLPLAFAACTNEDFESQANSPAGEGKTVNVVLSAERPQLGADTKMTINGDNQFVWEATTDRLGAGLYDANDNVNVRPFTADESSTVSTFTGTSNLPIGSYVFFYPYVDNLDSKVLPLDMPAQEYDPANAEKDAINQAVSYMKMISPSVNLEDGVAYDDVESYNLNLRFANLYTLVRVNIESTNIPAGVTPSVTKVTLNGKDAAGNDFVKEATADMSAIEGAGELVPEEGVLDEAELTAALEELEDAIMDGSIYAGAKQDNGTAGSIEYGAAELTVKEGCTLAAGNTTSLYILAPKGNYTELELTIETSEGTRTRTIEAANGSTFTLGNDIQPIGIDLDFDPIEGNVKMPLELEIASADDWADAIAFVQSHEYYRGREFSFELTKSIAVDGLPEFKVKINTASGVVLTLNKNYTVSKGNAALYAGSNATLGVAEDATLTLDADPAFAIQNNGTLEINTTVTKTITNLGTMNVNEAVSLSGAVTNGQVKTAQLPEVAGTININANTTLSADLTNEVGTVTIAASTRLRGTGTFTNNDTVDNFGQLWCNITNNGTVKIEAGSTSRSTYNITGGEAIVMDITSFSKIAETANAYNFSGGTTVSTEVENGAEFTAAYSTTSINNVILNGGEWIQTGTAGTSSDKNINISDNQSKDITLNSATLTITTNNMGVGPWGGRALIIEGTSSITYDGDESGATINAHLNVAEGAALNVDEKVTFNSTTVSDQDATINGTLNVNPGAKMYFAEVTVEEGAAINVYGNTNTITDAAVFGAKTTFSNAGTVSSLASTATSQSVTKQAGQVSQPTNTETGKFNGNAATDIF